MNTFSRRLTAGLFTALAIPALALPHAAAEPGDDDGPTGPTPTVTAKAPATATGWYADSVVVTIQVSAQDEVEPTSSWTIMQGNDQLGTGQIGEGVTEVEVAAEGTSKVIYSVNTSGGGHRDGVVTVQVDGTEPTVTFDRGGALSFPMGAHELVGYSCADALSGVGSCTTERGGSPVLFDTSTRGRHFVTVTATDKVGNSGTSQLAYDVIAPDTTAPVTHATRTSGTAGQAGWWTTPVGYRITAEESTVDHEAASGIRNLDIDLDGEVSSEATSQRNVLVGDGRHVLKWAVADQAGNASGIDSVELNVDTVAPAAAFTYPTQGQHLKTTSSSVPVTECDDATSGLLECYVTVGDEIVGSLDTTPGAHTAVLHARDIAGNATVTEVDYVVDAPPAHPVVRSTTKLSQVKVSRTRTGTARVQITAGYTPRGKVVITDGTKRIATVTIPPRKSARVGLTTLVVKLPKLARGRHVLRATYLGASDIRRSASKPVVVQVR